MTNLQDGLGTANLTILETGSVAVLVAGAAQIGTSEIGSAAVLPVNCGSGVPVIRTGSPAAHSPQAIEYGTGATLSAASVLWVAFGSPFAAAPIVFAQNNKTSAKTVLIFTGSTNAGSFYAVGEAAADTFDWLAIGKR